MKASFELPSIIRHQLQSQRPGFVVGIPAPQSPQFQTSKSVKSHCTALQFYLPSTNANFPFSPATSWEAHLSDPRRAGIFSTVSHTSIVEMALHSRNNQMAGKAQLRGEVEHLEEVVPTEGDAAVRPAPAKHTR
jgi:hypothetical protein